MVLPIGNTKTDTWVQAKIHCNSVNIQYKNTSQKLTHITHNKKTRGTDGMEVHSNIRKDTLQYRVKFLIVNTFHGRNFPVTLHTINF